MKRLAAKLLTVYVGMVKLYPSHYQYDFGEERQEVFTQALEEAINRGNKALFQLVLCELHDFPASVIRANLREWEVMMKTIDTQLGEEHFSWIGLLLGAWPFIFAGPMMAMLPYLPQQITQKFNFNTPLWLATVGLSLLLGIFVGWRKNYPRWVYPYLVILFSIIVIPLLSWIGPLWFSGFNAWATTAIILSLIIGFGAAALFLLSHIPSTRKIFFDIRSDWTRLSFGMVVFLAFGTGLSSGDHLPPFGVTVLLPSAIVVFGAVAYLLSRSRRLRILVLLTTIGLCFLGLSIIPNTETWAIWPALTLVMLILSPMLVGLFPHPHPSQAN